MLEVFLQTREMPATQSELYCVYGVSTKENSFTGAGVYHEKLEFVGHNTGAAFKWKETLGVNRNR